MGFDTSGYVLKSARSAPSNAISTAATNSGVLREHANLPGSYDLPGDLVEVAADQYRSSVLDNPILGTQEYLLWAANTSNLAILEDSSWAIDQGIGSIPVGSTSFTVGPITYVDGTDRVIVTDGDNRSIASVLSMVLIRGDSPLSPIVATFASQDADAGIVTLSPATLTALGGGLSVSRGDSVLSVSYYLAAQKFWWTRNDSYLQRFGWNGTTQKWTPYKGSAPSNLGLILDGASYTLTPHPSRFAIGDTLPGDPLLPDAYAMVRIGRRPDADSVPANVLVVSDEDANETYSFPIGVDAVVGVSSGVLQWNPLTVASNSGRKSWYLPETYTVDSNGIVGLLISAGEDPLFITPIPGLCEYPFIRIGSRRHLQAMGVDTESDLLTLTVLEGQVGWARSTGRLKFNDTDVEKSDPDAAGFELLYLGAVVVYDGVSLTSVPIGTREPVALVDSAGAPTTVNATRALYLPASVPLPSPGVSGVMLIPDNTGVVPNTSAVPGTRPNGSGLIRSINGSGDLIVFGKPKSLEQVEVVEFEKDLPTFPFHIKKGRAFIAKELGSAGSQVMIGHKDRRIFNGESLYFLQAEVQPSTYTTEARFLSRVREPFVLEGTEFLYFAIDGVSYVWDASSLAPAASYTADEIASSINAIITGTGSVTIVNGRLLLSSGDISTGSVEIGFGSSGAFFDRDFSGCSALGFPPGWRAVGGADNWLPDAGLSFGVFRSPQNKDRSQDIADFKAIDRFESAVLSKSVTGSPVFLLNNPPLLDVAGYDVGVFFQTVDGFFRRSLVPFKNVLYEFEQGRFSWLDETSLTVGVSSPTTSLSLGATGVVGLTLHPSVGTNYGLYLDEIGAPFVLQELGEDYLLDQSGSPGTATLIERIGSLVTVGSLGSLSGTTFTDTDATFVSDGVVPGYRLKIVNGDSIAQGSYIVQSVTSETEIEVSPSFLVAESVVSWEIYAGVPPTGYDPGLLADVLYEQFNHLPDEPFRIRVLSPLGPTPEDASAQSLLRLQAIVSEALANDRPISVRFGQDPSGVEATVTVLEVVSLGTIANGSLVLPLGTHFNEGSFEIVVGAQTYSIGTNLTGVVAFSDPLLGDQIEYGLPLSGIEGELKFGETTLADLDESLVYYAQIFSDPADLPQGESEVDPISGDLNLSSIDMADHGGEEAYFVEEMITRDRKDVAISPLQGAVYFNRPLRAFQLVEASYFQADVSGNKIGSLITEFLPLFVRLETATGVSTTEYSFNPSGRTVREEITPQVWVDSRLQSYGNTLDVTIEGSSLFFVSPIESVAVVQLNYAVNETFGGEQGFSVSTIPVYRPPFFLIADADSFELKTDRTGDMIPGKLLRIGPSPFYIKAASYDVGTDITSVTIFPTPEIEAGSRAPGNDVLSLISSNPVTTSVDGVSCGGDPGFMLLLSASYEPVDKGMLSIVFHGDVSQFTVAGHLLEIGGYPILSAGSVLSSDGMFTRVDVTSPFLKGFDPTVDSVKVSVRPVYPPAARTFVGLSPVIESEPLELVLFGETDTNGAVLPGKSLISNRDFSIDFKTGDIGLLAPIQEQFLPDQKLFLSYTKHRALKPILQDGRIVVPRYHAGFAHVTIPSTENKFLNSYLVATYTFSSPDSFYVRTVPLSQYMGEVARIAIDRVGAQTPHGGPLVVAGPSIENWQFGTVPIISQERELQDQDRAARVFLSLYDSFVQAFEQINETILGDVIGDRDGKFRFFIGRNKVYAGPGYEDQITGLLIPRFVWSQVFEAGSGSFGVTVNDPIVDPETATQDPITLEVSGDPMNPWLLDFYIKEQRAIVQNDMDDVILAGKDRAKLVFPFSFKVLGAFKQMWEPSVISRLYPEYTLAFTTTYPGLLAGTLPENPGVYAFLKMLSRPRILKGEGPVFGSTFGQDIGDVSNPAIGLIQNITGQVHPRARLPRARIWAYSPTGFPDIDPATDGKPSVLATPLLLRDFPVDPISGLPDTARFASLGGDLQDLSTGDIELSTPKWEPYDDVTDVRPQVAFGRPDGETYSVGCASGTIANAFSGALPFVDPIYKGLFVAEIYSGCIITFTNGDGNEITNASDIIRIAEDGVSTLTFDPIYGDTIYVIPPASADASGFSDPPSVSDLKKFARQQPFLDVGVRERRSAFVDRSLPSSEDPSFPIKEIVNQRSASPLQPIEADVEFVNTSRDPLLFPALSGLPTNDFGDYGIPYLSSPNTEVERLGAVQSVLTSIVQTDGPLLTHTWLSVYPDEIVGNDGSILSVASGSTPPATLLSARDYTPVATAGVYTDHSGIGDARPYDLLLIEKDQVDVVTGAQGILSVGSVSSATLSVPRFVTPTLVGTRIRYLFTNAMVHLSTSGLSGVEIQENGGLTTTLDITTVGGLFFNNGSGALVGGLNNIISNGLFAYPNDNSITIDIIDQGTGFIVETVFIQGGNVTGGLGTVAMGAMPTFSQKVLTITAIGFIDFAALGGVAPGPVGPFDFAVTINTFMGAPLTGSDTAFIDTDRLTFVEDVDLRTVLPRGTLTIGGVSVQGELSVLRVMATGACTVNSPSSINGGDPFTFLARNAGSPTSIGTFDPFPGTGTGSVTVMGFEGHNNTPIPSTGAFTFSAIPSSDQNASGSILSGTGDVYTDENRVRTIVPLTGGISNVEPGDVLVVTGSDVGDAAVTTGSYIVRHAIPDAGGGYTEIFPVSPSGDRGGWIQSVFPKVVSATLIPFELTVDAIQAVTLSPSGFDFPAAGRVFILPNPNDLTTVLSVDYTAFVVAGTVVFSLTAGTVRDASGALGPTDIDFVALASSGVFVSGMTYLPVGQLSSSLPSNNVVGFDSGGTTIGGFVNITFVGKSGNHTFAFGVDLINATTGAPAPTELGIAPADIGMVNDSTGFVSDISTPVFIDVPVYSDLTGLDDPSDAGIVALWQTIHGAGLGGVTCIVPWMMFHAGDGAATVGTGMQCQSGVFIEPSSPRPVQDLGNGELKVVDAGNTVVNVTRIGMRDPVAFGGVSPEPVSFSVRRIRRFHVALNGIGTNLAPLRFAYEIRTGVVDTYTGLTLVAIGDGTQLGGFDDGDVNIHPGDVVRILDVNGVVLDTAEIASITAYNTVVMRAPGFAENPPIGGETFQVYLKQAPVPHIQSNEQLLELITDQVILTRTADPVGNTGGRVTTVNEMQDNGIADFSTLSPLPAIGDIVLVDPAGILAGPTGFPTPSESGSRAFGDQSVSTRLDGSYIAGGPGDLDDNRGWYRITEDPSDTITYLAVSGVTEFSGSDGSPVILGSDAPTNQQFTVIPDITGSGLTGGTEGQMDLRPTHTADGSNSYQDGSFKSIEPFSYRIIRPTNLVSSETVDLILFQRERILSWVEEMSSSFTENKQGSYYVFQRDEHIADIGSSTGSDGLGVPSNVYISSVSGLTQYAPFANVSDCLSVLDRRYWCLDTRLDREEPPYSVGGDPYSSFEEDMSVSGYTVGSGRPIGPDLVTEVLNNSDRLRSLRYSWIKFRSNQGNGTLPQISRFLIELPRLIQEQEDLLLLQQSIQDAS